MDAENLKNPHYASDFTVSTQMPRIGLIDISQSHKSGYHGEGKNKKKKRKKKQVPESRHFTRKNAREQAYPMSG